MKRKYFLIVLFLILAMFLSGCGIITDEEKVRNVVDEYFISVSNQDWDKAKGYCIYESEMYYSTCDFEDQINDLYQSSSFVDLTFFVDIFDIHITGNHASAYIDGILTIITDDSSIIDNSSGHFYLQKVDNNWKLFNSGD